MNKLVSLQPEPEMGLYSKKIFQVFGGIWEQSFTMSVWKRTKQLQLSCTVNNYKYLAQLLQESIQFQSISKGSSFSKTMHICIQSNALRPDSGFMLDKNLFYPPYSLDITLSDFQLFLNFKNYLREKNLTCRGQFEN